MSADASVDGRLLARHLGAITRAIRIHRVGNRAVSGLIRWCARDLTEMFRVGGDARVELDLNGVLIVNRQPQRLRREVRTQLLPLATMMRELGVGGFKLGGDVSESALLQLFALLHEHDTAMDRVSFQAALDDAGAGCFRLLVPRVLVAGLSGGPGSAVRVAAAESLQAYIRAVLAVDEARGEGTLLRIPPAVFRAAQGLADLADGDVRMHLALTALKEDLDYGTRHPVHSMIFAMALGSRLGLPRTLLVELGIAAMVCASMPEDAAADEVLSTVMAILPTARLSLARARRMLAVFEFRSGLDRTGPPYIELDSPPHLFGRICAIATRFDRLTTSRPGEPGVLADEALALMGGSADNRLDPELLRLFASVVGRYPLGTALLLDNGEVGVVIHTPSDPALAARPLVRIVRDERGALVRYGPIVDLSDPGCPRSVKAAVDAEALGIDARGALFG
ncbi:MAG: hypothetical protein EXR71_13105 [Myxococcales bacterium]|nr:hypothetical protein [Myxococcales bacterium]